MRGWRFRIRNTANHPNNGSRRLIARPLGSIDGLHTETGRKRLAVCPNGTVDKGFLLPDRHRFLEGVDEPAAGLVGLRTMGRSDDDDDTGLTDLKTAKAVNDRDLADAKPVARLAHDFVELAKGHFLVGLIVQMERLAATRIVANDA